MPSWLANFLHQDTRIFPAYWVLIGQFKCPARQPYVRWGEHSKGLSNQADFELDMINAISAADIAFIMSSSQAFVNWFIALDQSDFS